MYTRYNIPIGTYIGRYVYMDIYGHGQRLRNI